MKNEEKLRKLIIMIASIIAVIGGYAMLTRGNPIDKMIGKLIITNGVERIQIDGYKYSYNIKDKTDINEDFITINNVENIEEIDYYPNGNNIAISYSEEYVGDLSYTVYDSEFNAIIEKQPNLVMPGEIGKKYYIEVGVNWGSSQKNVTVMYYFAINIAEKTE